MAKSLYSVSVNGFDLDWSGPDIIFGVLLNAAREYDRLFKAYNLEEARTTAFWKLYEFLGASTEPKKVFNAVLINEVNLKDVVLGTRELGMLSGAKTNNIAFAVPGIYEIQENAETALKEISKVSDTLDIYKIGSNRIRFCIIFYFPKDESWMTEILEHKQVKSYGKGTGRLSGCEIGGEILTEEEESDVITYVPSQAEITAADLAKNTLNIIYGIETAEDTVKSLETSAELNTKASVHEKILEYKKQIADQQAAAASAMRPPFRK